MYAGAGFTIFCLAVGIAAAATHPAAIRRWSHALINTFTAEPASKAEVPQAFVPPPPPPPYQEQVVSEPVRALSAGTYVWWKFTLDDPRPCRLKGRVSVIDGGSHDVDVMVVDEDGFINFQNGHQYSAYLLRSRTSAVTLDVALDGYREYYLVVSNRFSVFTGKTVVFDNIQGICDSSVQ